MRVYPAYLGEDESVKNYTDMVAAGCDTWRNWADIDNKWESLSSIINHWALYTKPLQAAGNDFDSETRGSWNNADMILAGDNHYNNVLPLDQGKLQLTLWAVIANPLWLGGDVRKITKDYQDAIQNKNVIRVNQDALGIKGGCLQGCGNSVYNKKQSSTTATPSDLQIWGRNTVQGSVLAFTNMAAKTADSPVSYSYTVPAGMKIYGCYDLWATPVDSRPDLCHNSSNKFENDEWKLIVEGGDVKTGLQITVKSIPATGQKSLEIVLEKEDVQVEQEESSVVYV